MTAKVREVQALGGLHGVSLVRRQRCAVEGCAERTRLALVEPLADIGEDGGPGLGCIILCGEHLEEGLISLKRRRA